MNRLQLLRRRIYARVPEWVRRNDFELFTATLCFTAGLPLLLTHTVEATSIEATLPGPLVTAWAVLLTLAPFAIGTGLFMRYKRTMAEATFWMRVEAWGLRALAYVAYVYAVAISLANGATTLPATMIVLIFAATCHSRATDVTIQVEDYLTTLGTDHAKP